MKNYKTIEKEIHAKAQEIESLNNAIETKADEISFKGMTLAEVKECLKDDERRAKKEEIENQISEMGKRLRIAEIELEMMKSNYIISCVHSEMPKAAAIISKYAGKRLGEITMKKIREEVKENTDIHYIRIESDKIAFSLKGLRGMMEYGDNRRNFFILDDDNKIRNCTVTEDCFIYYMNNEYISNTRKASEKVIKLKAKAEKQLEELRKTLYEYNELRRGNMRSYYADMR